MLSLAVNVLLAQGILPLNVKIYLGVRMPRMCFGCILIGYSSSD